MLIYTYHVFIVLYIPGARSINVRKTDFSVSLVVCYSNDVLEMDESFIVYMQQLQRTLFLDIFVLYVA